MAEVSPFVFEFSIFVLAVFVGYYVVWSVTPALHTPLMSVTNAISSVIIVGALIAVGVDMMQAGESGWMSKGLGFVAVILASVNIFGGFLVTRRITVRLAVVYWVTQLVAAIAGAGLLEWVLPKQIRTSINDGAPSLYSQIGSGEGVVIEAVLTFFLVWVVFATAADARGAFKQIAGLAIGFTITFDVLFAGKLTGGMMNPARAFGPQLVGNHWTNWWVWYLGPLAGGAVAAVLYELLYLRPTPAPVGPPEIELEEPAPGEAAAE